MVGYNISIFNNEVSSTSLTYHDGSVTVQCDILDVNDDSCGAMFYLDVIYHVVVKIDRGMSISVVGKSSTHYFVELPVGCNAFQQKF